MSEYGEKQTDIILILFIPILLTFGIGSLSKGYFTALISLSVLISSLLGWFATWLFKPVIFAIFNIKEDSDNKPRIGGKFTRINFQELYNASKFLITATIATLFNLFLDEWMKELAISYGETNTHFWIGGIAIGGAIIIIAYLMGWFRKKIPITNIP